MHMPNCLLIAIFILINAAIQIMFKTVALGPGGTSHLALFFEPLFYLCGMLFALQAAVWLAVLRRMPLSRAYPYTSLSMITLLICAAFFFGEAITLGNLLGALIIMAGIIIITGGRNEEEVDRGAHS